MQEFPPHPPMTTSEPSSVSVAYFSMEAALASDMPTYSGGLGVLAGDVLRAAADLRLPVVGMSLLYKQGFLQQKLSADGWQTEEPIVWQPSRFLKRLTTRATIRLEGRDIVLQPWL